MSVEPISDAVEGRAWGLRDWAADQSVFADAMSQARPYVPETGDVQAADRAWSARVDAAVHGMDCLDPASLDTWMNVHAESAEPHVFEAALVAVWETRIRQDYDTDEL